ncbi:fumarate hydratase subunit beta [Desulfonauticus submarinus]|uniref:Fumarate hydratase subunit beta n=1 Tax=Desulfonauticus submarinus TaxID=206665 RepID=A0A1H0AGK8_9BACT|nr:Fe-S-containing hydro-lyase [Desulfonauticus submarinus]SDN31876.1 fumarate hydratase subunit beta [Desulfonauticus submarinus]
MSEYKLQTPLTEEDILKLRSGDKVLLSGLVYTARDAAHKRLFQALEKGEKLPFPIEGAVIYYVGPSPAPPGRPIGSAGPTTSYRMDTYAPKLYELGLKATIGKGKRNEAVKDALKTYKGVYFGATGGAGALLSQCIKQAKVIAYEDLGPEAIRVLQVQDFPLLVINDAFGGELYAKPNYK